MGKLARMGMMLLIAISSMAAARPGYAATRPDVSIPPLLPGIQTCPNPMGVVKAFYDDNDAVEYDASLALLTPDVTLVSWAEGVNGRHWAEIHLQGKERILPLLAKRGLRRTNGEAETPVFNSSEVKVSGSQVSFMLRPDRLGPGGKPYNPYKVETGLLGCKIKSLKVIMYFTVP